jgi:proteasome lid subunit RPN8/RPN11
MPESPTENAPCTWKVPQCPFTVEYVPRVLDDIRLAVVDAFFSLPRGGAEIGGVLLGRHADARVTITDHLPMDCEHATGPSFVLSANDEAELEKLFARIKAEFPDLLPVGWYHSHTRSEIFLSDTDQALYQHFFPESWQVSLVLKPHTFQPMRCGFFFREGDGSLHAGESYNEFTLEPLPLRTVPTGIVPPVATDGHAFRQPDFTGAGSVIEVSAGAAVATAIEPPIAEVPVEAAIPESPAVVEPPMFAAAQVPPSRPWAKIGMGVFLGLAVCAAGFQIGQNWLPKVMGAGKSAPVSALTPLTLSLLDTNGQLQIHWDRSATAVQQGTAAELLIHDGLLAPHTIRLDQDHVRSGSFTYARENERVDVSMRIERPGSSPEKVAATFVGEIPKRSIADNANSQTAKLKNDLAAQLDENRKIAKQLADEHLLVSQAAAQVERIKKLEKSLSEAQTQASDSARLRKDLAAANDRNKKLAQSLIDVQNELKQQQRRRLGNQDPGKQ